MNNAFTSNFLVWDVKNDATAFIFPTLKFTFLLMLLIWFDHCIFSSKITLRYLTSFLCSSGVPRYLTVLLSSFFRWDLFPKKITSVVFGIYCHFVDTKPLTNIKKLPPDLQLNCLGQMHFLIWLCHLHINDMNFGWQILCHWCIKGSLSWDWRTTLWW